MRPIWPEHPSRDIQRFISQLANAAAQRGVVAGFQLAGGGQAGLQRGGGERGQERPGDRGVDRGAADPHVPVAAAGSRRAASAVVAGRGRVRSVLRQAGLPETITVPWWGNRTLRYEYA